jgi:hypothetical protein
MLENNIFSKIIKHNPNKIKIITQLIFDKYEINLFLVSIFFNDPSAITKKIDFTGTFSRRHSLWWSFSVFISIKGG